MRPVTTEDVAEAAGNVTKRETCTKASEQVRKEDGGKGKREGKHSEVSSSEVEEQGSERSKSKAEIIAERIYEECKRKDQRKKAFEWIEKRGSRGKAKTEIFYKGAEFSKKELREARRECKKKQKNPKQKNEGERHGLQRQEEEQERIVRKQGKA